MRKGEGNLNRFRAAAAAMLRACCAALLVGVSACGGGDDDAAPPSAEPAPTAEPDPTPAPVTTQPALRVVGAALSIDGGASGSPVSLRVARSANGDGFAVWRADDGTRHNLWCNRYRAATAAWESPINIEASSANIDDFDLAVDASGNAVVIWHEVPADPRLSTGVVMSARFHSGSAAWAAPVLLSTDAREPRVASDATGAVLAVYVAVAGHVIRGRFFDPVSGTWQPEALIEQNNTGTGFSYGPTALLDGSGNALAAWGNGRTGASIVASNYFSHSDGGWVFQLTPNETDLLGAVPGSFTASATNDNVQLAASAEGNFVLAWQKALFDDPENSGEIRSARFTSGTRVWSAAQTLVPSSGQNIQLQRIGSDAGGNALVLWTESIGMRTALKAIRVDSGASCSGSAMQVIDSAIGGGAARADLGVDPLGDAIVIWQQFEGGRIDDGSRSNIAINRFDRATGAWANAVFAETQPGNAISPRASANGGQALLGWIQLEDGVNRVKALLQPLVDPPSQ
jgi:hypothetical protein